MTDTPQPSFLQRVIRKLLGAPIATAHAHHERLGPFIGLPVFSSDALSSVAYATEAILQILVLLSAAALSYQIWISLSIVILIVIISISYQQTIHAYPSGGGSYIVAGDNLGELVGLIAGAALLVDYILTVSVSVAAGVAAILSAFPAVKTAIPDAHVTISLLCVAVIGFANLRGLRESGTLFAIPTYGFILSMIGVIGYGIYCLAHTPTLPTPVVRADDLLGKEAHFLPLFVVLRAFSAGCTALTGIEAVSNGVQAFRAPEAKNATTTLRIMSMLLTVLFLGLGYIALHLPEHYASFSIHSSSHPQYITLTAQVAAFAFGLNSPGFYIVQAFVAAILILAANTAFADFPRLASLISRDGYLPRYLSRLGDKLVFHNGIVVLCVASAGLIVLFKGELDQLLPLYAVGVFTAFTLSQTGMVVHWYKLKNEGWIHRASVNAVGAILCFIVLLIIGFTKFTEGAWIVIVLLPIIVATFIAIKRHYRNVAARLQLESELDFTAASSHKVLLLVPRVNKGVVTALDYARQLKGDIEAVHVTLNERTLPDLQRKWSMFSSDIPLVVLPSPYRSLITPVLDYVDELKQSQPGLTITVIVAESVSDRWYHRLLTENVAQQLKNSLAKRPRVVVANVRYFLN